MVKIKMGIKFQNSKLDIFIQKSILAQAKVIETKLNSKSVPETLR